MATVLCAPSLYPACGKVRFTQHLRRSSNGVDKARQWLDLGPIKKLSNSFNLHIIVKNLGHSGPQSVAAMYHCHPCITAMYHRWSPDTPPDVWLLLQCFCQGESVAVIYKLSANFPSTHPHIQFQLDIDNVEFSRQWYIQAGILYHPYSEDKLL